MTDGQDADIGHGGGERPVRQDPLADLVGTPYQEGAGWYTDDGPADCWGLVRRAVRRLGYDDFPDYSAGIGRVVDWVDRGLSEHGADFEPVSEPRRGDLVVMRYGGQIWHVGIMLDRWRALHTSRRSGQAIISHLGRPAWRRLVRGYYRWRGLHMR